MLTPARSIFAEPSNATPPIFLVAYNFVAVSALPINAPPKLGAVTLPLAASKRKVDLLLTPKLPVASVANSTLQVVSVCSSETVTVVAMSAVPVRSPVIAVMFAASAYIPCHLTEVVPKSYAVSYTHLTLPTIYSV